MEKRLREFCMNERIPALWHTPLSDYTSFRIGGPADAFLLPDTEKSFLSLLHFLAEAGIPFRVIGNGTNLLDVINAGLILDLRNQLNILATDLMHIIAHVDEVLLAGNKGACNIIYAVICAPFPLSAIRSSPHRGCP